MDLHIHNFTEDAILLNCSSQARSKDLPSEVLALSLSTSTTRLHKSHRSVALSLPAGTPDSVNLKKGMDLSDDQATPLATFKLKLRSSWKAASLPESSPWRVYSKKVNPQTIRLTVFPRRKLSSYLAEMPDTLPLSSLLLPGTHDTMAFYGWPISQCQFLANPLMVQLQNGIRVLDIRLGVSDGQLLAYHGIYPQRTPFKAMVQDLYTFLTSPEGSSETIVMSMKQEDAPKTSTATFSQMVHDDMMSGPGGKDFWFAQNRIPRLGEVRGKVVLFSRFAAGPEWEGGYENSGIHPTNWPDSPPDIFTWQCKNTLVRTSDWYAIPSFLSIPEKAAKASSVLLPPSDTTGLTLSISFFSASSFPLSLPPLIARGFGWPKVGLGFEGVNSRVVKWLLDQFGEDSVASEKTSAVLADPRLRGWAMIDFYSDPDQMLLALLVECNYHGRKAGEEGWPSAGFRIFNMFR